MGTSTRYRFFFQAEDGIRGAQGSRGLGVWDKGRGDGPRGVDVAVGAFGDTGLLTAAQAGSGLRDALLETLLTHGLRCVKRREDRREEQGRQGFRSCVGDFATVGGGIHVSRKVDRASPERTVKNS